MQDENENEQTNDAMLQQIQQHQELMQQANEAQEAQEEVAEQGGNQEPSLAEVLQQRNADAMAQHDQEQQQEMGD